jgi:hypothetical protein
MKSIHGKRMNRGKKRGATPATGFTFFKHAGLQGKSDSLPFFQPALAISQPSDKYEREADTVADKVTNGQQTDVVSAVPPISPVQKSDLKKEEKTVQKMEEKEEEKPVQKVEEKKEEESTVQKADEKKEEEEPVQMAAAEEKEEEEPVQKKEDFTTVTSGADYVQRELGRHSSNGTPLPATVRAEMEGSFGTSFGSVKVHTHSTAQQMSKAIGAKAFTHGNDIYFNSGYYAPESQQGRHLLAHELTHVVQQRGGKQQTNLAPGQGSIHRELERDAAGQPTGNYLFRVGTAISGEFMRRFKQYVADGTLTDDELNTLRLYAINQRGTVTQAERLLMAAGLEPANHPLIAAHTTGVLSIPINNITAANRDHVNNIGRGTLSAEYEQMFLRAMIAFFSLNFDEAAAELANINAAAIQEILSVGGRSWQTQAEGLVAFIEAHNISALQVLSAMYSAASDSSSGDKIMAGIVYATAFNAGHPTASQLASGNLKVDALIPSALQKLTNNSGVDAFYSPASLNDRVKSDTLYVPTTLDILSLPARALIIHELTHGSQDASVAALSIGPQIDMEIPAYRAQVKYVMDQLIATPPDALDREVFSTRGLANMALFQWAFIIETMADRARYEAIAKRILLQSSSVSEADINNALAMSQADVLQRLRNAILAMPQYGGNPNIARDGLRGQSILDNVN